MTDVPSLQGGRGLPPPAAFIQLCTAARSVRHTSPQTHAHAAGHAATIGPDHGTLTTQLYFEDDPGWTPTSWTPWSAPW